MILSKDFVEMEIRTRKWGRKLRQYLDEHAVEKDEHFEIEKEQWDNFLVDVGIKKSRGVGDLVAKATKAIGIKPCGGCQKRRKKLNKILPL